MDRRPFATTVVIAAVVLGAAGIAEAQPVEISPAVGYRLGLSPYYYPAGTVIGSTSGISFGAAVDVKYAPQRAIQGLFSRQVGEVTITDPLAPPVRLRVTVDYWHGGGIQEFGRGRVRPYLAGTLGVTRYGEAGYSTYRFSVGAGGGVKLMANPHVGARLDGRLYATIVGGSSSIGICGGGGCLVRISVGSSWQADFSAGVLFIL
jgi:hypothetical protein